MLVFGFAALSTVAVSAALPAGLVAEKVNPRVGEVQPTPYARTPSSAQPVDDRVRFGQLDDELGGAVERFPASSSVYFVTVTEPQQSVLSWWVGRDEPAIEFLTDEQKFGLQTPEQRRVFALESMRSSEQVAQFVALDALGYEVEIVPGDVLVQQLVCLEPSDDGRECLRESPSAEFLEPGDRLIAADGVELEGVEDLTRVVSPKAPGDTLELRLERPQEGELTVTVELTVSPTDPDRTIVGFVPFDTRRVVLPFEVSIDTGRIGGPSAGLAFTLALIDQLTPGDLLGGRDVAVTGTIELDGSVGAIGGLRQKASAVAQSGVEVFLVPAAQSDADIEAARRAGGDGLEVVPVASLDEALEVLASLGGAPVDDRSAATATD
ncbi:protease DdcP [soil metagenome]